MLSQSNRKAQGKLLIGILVYVSFIVSSNASNTELNKDIEGEVPSSSSLNCRSDSFSEQLDLISMPQFDAWIYAAISPFAIIIQSSFLVLSFEQPRLRAQPGDILIGAFVADFILTIHWYLEGLRTLISPSHGASESSAFCVFSSVLSILGGNLWVIYHLLFFGFIGISMQNSLQVKIISSRALHTLVWTTAIAYLGLTFILRLDGKNLFGTCSFAFDEFATPMTSILVYFAFLTLSVVFFSRFQRTIPNTSFYERQRTLFHIFTRAYLIAYLSTFGITTFANSYVFINCQYFQSSSADYVLKIANIVRVISSLFLPFLRLSDPYVQQILQDPKTNLQKTLKRIMNLLFKEKRKSITSQQFGQNSENLSLHESQSHINESIQNDKQNQQSQQLNDVNRQTVLKMDIISKISMQFQEDRLLKSLRLQKNLQDQLSTDSSDSQNRRTENSNLNDSILEAESDLKTSPISLKLNLLKNRSFDLDQNDIVASTQQKSKWNIKKSQTLFETKASNRTFDSLKIKRMATVQPKKASQFLKQKQIPFLNPQYIIEKSDMMKINEQLFDLFEQAPFLLDMKEYETQEEAHQFISRVEQLIGNIKLQPHFFTDTYYQKKDKRSKNFKKIDMFFGESDEEDEETSLVKEDKILAETMLDSKDHFIMILQRNIKTAVLCRILSGIQLQNIRKKRFCHKLDIQPDSQINSFQKIASAPQIRPSRQFTLFPTLRRQDTIFEEVKIICFSDDSIKSIIKEAPKQLLDSDSFDVVRMRVYAPMVFHSLLHIESTSSSQYSSNNRINTISQSIDIEKSFNLTNNLHQIKNASGSDGGKSGQFFFFSYDNKYLLKTIKVRELQIFLDRLPQYFKYLKSHPISLLAKILGIYTFEGLSENPIHLILMQNIASCQKNNILRTYDIKGSSFDRRVLSKNITIQPIGGRSVQGEQQQIPIKGGSISLRKLILKDEDFHLLEQSVVVTPEEQRRVFETLSEDAEFLCDCGLIDYSLIVFKVDRRILNRAQSSKSQTNNANQDQSEESFHSFYQVESCIENGIFYHFGIIDYLQVYSVSKKLEKVAKRIIHLDMKLDTSSQDPVTYCKRFIHAMGKIFEQSGEN